jgi:hypothetical protein
MDLKLDVYKQQIILKKPDCWYMEEDFRIGDKWR